MVTPGSDWKSWGLKALVNITVTRSLQSEIGTLIVADTFMGVDLQGCPDELQIRGPDSVMMVKFWPW